MSKPQIVKIAQIKQQCHQLWSQVMVQRSSDGQYLLIVVKVKTLFISTLNVANQ
ncbi:hypothetical protein [Anabaena catenula]|uniref:hypothetical protein n=1 Tax=Anabaena catenula TaxID=1296320 RepID=UPI001A7E5DCC|nr:hypothetical protein [Anabaena catenula]